MTRHRVDIDRVTQLLEDAARDLVMPRFRHLAATDVTQKDDADDLVTVVDRDVEWHLAAALRDIAPAAVVGEESVFADPTHLSALASDAPAWLIDPIDGTKNFAAGDPRFGLMVAYVEHGHTQAAWIVLPALGRTLVAERGAGARITPARGAADAPADAAHGAASDEGARSGPPPRDPPSGAVMSKYMPDVVRQRVYQCLSGRFTRSTHSGCAAVDYTAVIDGEVDFLLYYRLLPWDHAAPALILTERGGAVVHESGQPYTPRSTSQVTVVGANHRITEGVRAWLGDLEPGARMVDERP